ncbi:MAG: glycoside hydrolase family 5 protein [Treponema sp.]|nr:glycoside hydrolase family 5 protein [Treponema sp.]
MLFVESWKKFFFITIVLIIGFALFACNGTPDNTININNLPALRTDVISPGHQSPELWDGTTATALVGNIKLGWNLGNTFDAHGNDNGFTWLGGGVYANTSVTDMEKAWVNSITTKANITALKNAGFNAIRIPVTWYKALDSDYIIREDWLKRITEVVNWAEENDMYIIINTHHDEKIFKFTSAEIENSLIIFKRVWTQIATQFQNYNEKLIFEGLNEPRTKGSNDEWNGGTSSERANLNRYYQVFVDTVRAIGGNNSKRFLMVTTYAASAGQTAVDGLVLPNDTTAKSLIVSIHAYTPYNFALNTNSTFNTWSSSNSSDTYAIVNALSPAHAKFVSKGIPVIMGEFGAMNKNNDAAREAWAEYYVQQARNRQMPCFWWDNASTSGSGELFGLLNRSTNAIVYPQVMAGLKRGAGIQ